MMSNCVTNYIARFPLNWTTNQLKVMLQNKRRKKKQRVINKADAYS